MIKISKAKSKTSEIRLKKAWWARPVSEISIITFGLSAGVFLLSMMFWLAALVDVMHDGPALWSESWAVAKITGIVMIGMLASAIAFILAHERTSVFPADNWPWN